MVDARHERGAHDAALRILRPLHPQSAEIRKELADEVVARDAAINPKIEVSMCNVKLVKMAEMDRQKYLII